MVKGEFELASAAGTASGRNITLNGDGVGDVSLTLDTRGADLTAHATGVVHGAKIEADGEWKLAKETISRSVAMSTTQRVDLATAHRIYMIGGTDEQKNEVLPFEGYVEGRAKVAISLRKPQEFRAEVTLDQLQVNARKSQALRLVGAAAGCGSEERRPVVATITAKEVRIQSAEFAARDTGARESNGRCSVRPRAVARRSRGARIS